MPLSFWIRRFVIATVVTFVVLDGVYVLRGQPWRAALNEAAIWSVITAGIYVAVAWNKVRKGQRCAVCAIPADETATSEPDGQKRS